MRARDLNHHVDERPEPSAKGLRTGGACEWLLGLEGGLSIAFGVLLLLLSPLAGATQLAGF